MWTAVEHGSGGPKQAVNSAIEKDEYYPLVVQLAALCMSYLLFVAYLCVVQRCLLGEVVWRKLAFLRLIFNVAESFSSERGSG